MPNFEFENHNIHFDSTGSGPDIIFQHGLTANLEQALAACDGLRGYTVHSLDMPGHGRSAQEPELYSFNTFARILIAYMDHINVESAVLGGISMGSAIALKVAMINPDRAKGLMLIRPAWLQTGSPENLAMIGDIGTWLQTMSADDAKAELERSALFRDLQADNPNCAASIANSLKAEALSADARVFTAMVQDAPFTSLADLRSVRCPSLVVGNDADPLHPAEMARELSRALPESAYTHIPSRYLDSDSHQLELTLHMEHFLAKLS